MKRTIEVEAAGPKKRMTLAELRSFVAELTDAEGDAEVRAQVTFSGHLRSVKIEA